MALYGGAFKYGGSKYGNQVLLDAVTEDFVLAQRQRVRKVGSRIYINSHYHQVGRDVLSNKTFGGDTDIYVAQSFIAPKSFDLVAIEALIQSYLDSTSGVTAEIQSDNAGEPSGTILARGKINAPEYDAMHWKRITLNETYSLVGGTTYWIVLRNTSGTYENYIATGAKEISEGNSATWDGATWTADSSNACFFRLISDTLLDNYQIINEVIDWKLICDRDVPCYSFKASLVNDSHKFSIGQSYSSYMESGKEIKAYVGYEVNGAMSFYLMFWGETDDSPTTSSKAELKARCMMKKLVNNKVSSSVLGGLSYEDMIEELGLDSGIDQFDLRATGKTSMASISFDEQSASSLAEKVREATIDRMQFYNTKILTTTERTTVANADPEYALNDYDFIKDIKIEYENQNIVNRITVTNDEKGETTTDGQPITISDYQIIGTYGGTLGTAVETYSLSGTMSDSPVIYIQWRDEGTNSRTTEMTRYCGNSTTDGTMSWSIENLAYTGGTDGGTAQYLITVYGCPVTNADTNTILAESFGQTSWESYGKYPDRVNNKIYAAYEDAKEYADAYIDERAMPLHVIKANCRGHVDIFPDDAVIVNEPNKLKISNIAITRMVEYTYNNDPAEFSMYYEGIKTPLVSGILLNEDGGAMLQESGFYMYY